MELLNQNDVSRPPGVVLVIYIQSFGHVAPVRPPMMQQNQVVPNLVRGQAPPRPMIQQNLLLGQVPVSLVMQQDQFITYLVPHQAPTRPMMQQDEVVPL